MKCKFRPLLIKALNKLTTVFLAEVELLNPLISKISALWWGFEFILENGTEWEVLFVEPKRQNGRKAMTAS